MLDIPSIVCKLSCSFSALFLAIFVVAGILYVLTTSKIRNGNGYAG